LDLTHELSIGMEETGEAVFFADAANVASIRTITVRYRVPSRWIVLAARVGAGWASYRTGDDALLKNHPAFIAAFELGRRIRPVQLGQDFAFYTSRNSPWRDINDSRTSAVPPQCTVHVNRASSSLR
jgi:hypothetical protein